MDLDIKELIREYFEYFYSKFMHNPNYSFALNKRNDIIINNFFKYLKDNNYNIETYGEEFWFNYFSFQFEYWRTKSTFKGKNQVYFQWIVGEEAWKRFLKKSPDYLYFCEKGILKFCNIKKEDLIKQKLKQKYNFNFAEEIKKVFNQEEKLGGCFLYSSGYNEKNIGCISCIEKEDCKKIKLCVI